jgi:hypothetical protein
MFDRGLKQVLQSSKACARPYNQNIISKPYMFDGGMRSKCCSWA